MKDSTSYQSDTYSELIAKGYKPTKKYKRFILLEKGNLKQCILWCDVNTKEARETLQEFNESIQKHWEGL